MKKVIAYVNAVNGRYYANSPEGEVRALNQGDPIYEGDAVFSQNNGTDGVFIELLYSNGESVTLADTSYYLADEGIAGEQDAGINTQYPDPDSDEYQRLRGRTEGSSETAQQADAPDSESSYTPDNIDSEIISYTQAPEPELPLDAAQDEPAFSPQPRLLIPGNNPNLPPVAEDSAVRGTEDTPYTFNADDFPYTDPEGDLGVSVRIGSLPESGTLIYDGTPVTVGTVVPFSGIESGRLIFMPDPDENGETYTTFIYAISDGNSFSPPGEMTVHIDPVNDPAILTNETKTMTETGGILITEGKLDITDIDSPEEFIPQTDFEGQYGKFSIDKDGNWTFTSYTPYSELNDGDTLTETFTVKGIEGEETTVTVIINGVNDPAILTNETKTMTETGGILITEGKLDITDIDSPEEFVPQTDFEGQYGKFSIDKDGNWTFTSYTPYSELNDGDTLTETFTVQAVDGTETTVTVNINGVDDPTVFAGITDQVYTENDPAVVLAPQINLADPDSSITGASVKIENVQDGDLLSFTPQTGITGIYDSATGTLTLSGEASADVYKALLESVTFVSSSDDPTVDDTETIRNVTWTVTDEHEGNYVLTSEIDITPLTDNPIVEAEGDIHYNSGAPALAVDSTISLSDVDDTHLASAAVSITGGFDAGDKLNFTDQNGITGSYNPATGVLTLTGYAALEDYEAALRSVTFESDSIDYTERTITWTVTDANSDNAGAGTGFDTSVIHIHEPVSIPEPAEVTVTVAKDAPYIAITLTAEDPINTVAVYKITSLPENGKLYLNPECTVELEAGVEYPATNEELTVYFKPDYGTNPDQPYCPDKYTSGDLTFNYQAKNGVFGSEYSDDCLATIIVDDVPYAYSAEDKIVTETGHDGSPAVVTGNLIIDGGNHGEGLDYVPTGEEGEVYEIKYIDENGDGQTALVGESVTVTTEHGELTVYKDGSYEFEYGNLDHTDSDEITVTFEYNIISDGDVSSNWATQNIIIKDGNDPEIGEPQDSTLNEAYLPGGTMSDEPDAANYTTTTGTLDVTGGSDSFTVKFSDDAIGNLPDNLKSKGVDITYEKIDDYTIKAVAGGNDVFVVTITDPTDETAGYEFELKQPLDGSPDYEFDFKIIIADSDGDEADGTFKITVLNDSPTVARELETDEDTPLIFTANADATHENTTIQGAGGDGKTFTTETGGTVTIEPDGTIKYVPAEDYSGADTFTYTTDTGSEVKTITVNLTINPVADAPDWETVGIGNKYTTPEDANVAVFTLPLPIITDTDTNSYERLGLIELKPAEGTPAVGYEIQKADGTVIFDGSSDTSIKIVLVDDDGNPLDTYHYSGIDTDGAIELTVEEYQTLVFVPNPQDHRNVTFGLEATSYEINEDGSRNTEVDGAENSTSVTVDVQAVTDTVTLGFAAEGVETAIVNEDSWVRLDTLFNFTSDDMDGSESFKLIVESASLDGWQFNTVGNNTGAATISGGKFELPIGGANQIWVKPPANNSTDVGGITAKIVAEDSDNDSSHTIGTTDSEVTFGIEVLSIPDGVNATVTGGGDEHQNIPFTIKTDFKDKVSDGEDDKPEVLETVKIDFSAIPEGYAVHYSNEDGDELGAVELTDGKLTVAHNQTSDYTGHFVLVPSLLDNVASADFNGNIPITVTTVTSQNEDGAANKEDVANLNVRVKGIVDTIGGNDSGYDHVNGSLGFKYDGDYVAKGVALDPGSVDEDKSYFLNVSVESLEKTGDGSEKVTLIIKNTAPNNLFGFKIVDSDGKTIGSKQSDGWHIPQDKAGDAHVLPDPDFSGVLNLELKTLVQDMFGTTVDSTYSQTNTLTLTVNPVADDPYILVREVFTREDLGVLLDIRPIPSDTDESEVAHSVKIADIPIGASFIIDGVEVHANSDGSGSEVTFTIGDTVNGVEITESALSSIIFYPPADSNVSIVLQVTPVIKESDGSESRADLVIPVTVHVQGVADVPVIELNGTDVPVINNETDTLTVTGTEGSAIPISITAVSGEASNDGSETISFLLGDVPDSIRLVKIVEGEEVSIGLYMKDEKKWALTAEEMEALHFKPLQSDYSDRIEMTLYTVVTENDGDSRVVESPLVLEIEPVVGADAASVIGTAYGDEDGLIYLSFNDPADSSEAIVSIRIPEGSINTDDFTLVVDNGDETVTAIEAEGGFYDISQYYRDGVKVALQVKQDEGAGKKHVHTEGGEITIAGIEITVTDSNDSSGSSYEETDTNVIIGNMDVVIEAVADAPEISGDDTVNSTGYNYAHLNLSALYPDGDESEFHYFIIKGDTDGWYLNDAATYNGDGTWYVSKGDLGSVGAAAHGTGTYNLTVVGYSVEGSNGHTATSEHDISFTVTHHDGGEDPSWQYAQEPILTLNEPTIDEDAELTLADFIDEARTDDDGNGNEKLSLVIKNLPAGVTLVSDTHSNISHYTDNNGQPAVRINFAGGTATDLDQIKVVLPEHYSGQLEFSIYAVATEYGDGNQPPNYASTGENAFGTVDPVADGISAAAHGDMAQVLEDAPTQLRIDIKSLDTYEEGADKPETYGNVRITAENGSLTDSLGNVLADEGEELAVTVDQDGTVKHGETLVYVKSKLNSDESITIHVKADTYDETEGVGNDTALDQTASFEIGVKAVPDPAVLTANNVAGDEDTVIALNIDSVFDDMDGSEIHSLKISGLPAGALIVDAVSGDIVGMNIGNGEWNITGLDLSTLAIMPTVDFSGDINLRLHSYAIEKSTFEVGESYADFTVSVNPVADGVVVTPHNAEGVIGEYFKPAGTFLEGALIETERYKQSPSYNEADPTPSRTDETYGVTFKGLSEGMSFQTLNGVYEMGEGETSITITGLTQEEFDSLEFKSEITTGSIKITAEVWSIDGESESDTVETSFTVTVNDAPEGFMSPFGMGFGSPEGDVITITDNHIDLSSLTGSYASVGTINLEGTSSISGLSVSDFLLLDVSGNMLTINGDGDDSVALQNGEGGDWQYSESEGGYDVYVNSDHGLTVKIDVDITATVA